MKKITLLLFALLYLSSCSITKENKAYRKTVNGKWIIDNVTYQGPKGKFTIKNALGEGKPECFIGSTWDLVQNNSSGTYILPGGAGCNAGKKAINWSIFKPSTGFTYFQYKVIDSGAKAKNIVSGYRLKVDRISETQMSLRSSNKIEGENQSYDIIYHFKRSN